MKVLKRGFAAFLIMMTFAIPARSEPSVQVVARYDFYIGGLRIAEISLDATAEEGTYRARSSAVTRGVLDVLLRGRSASEARGRMGTMGRLLPADFSALYSSRRGEQKILIGYDGANPSEVVMDPVVAAGSNHAEPDERIGALDPLSAAVAALLPSREARLCNRSIPIFDGKRRFDILFLPPDPSRFEDTPPAPEWDKPLTQCLGVYERISGFDTPITENKRYYPFDIWFENSGDGVFRAVRIAGSTKLGFAIGNLRLDP